MCRNCPVPEWGEPIRVPVADLPQYFSKQISWNFERLNFGNAAVVDSDLDKPIRPTVTGKVGCKLREGVTPIGKDRFLLVSECLFCPGRRYGCTPRANCTGKRRNCWAQCKVSIYADLPNIAEIYYSGDHGEGNINDVNKHRPRPDVVNELKRKRRDGASPGEALQWFKKCVKEQGLNTSDPRQVPTDNQIKAMLKRIKPDSRPTMAPVGLSEVVSHFSAGVGTSESTGSYQPITTEAAALDDSLLHLGNSLPELSVQTSVNGFDDDHVNRGESDNDVGEIQLVRDIGTSTSVSTSQNFTNISPLNTPFTLPDNSRGCLRESPIVRHSFTAMKSAESGQNLPPSLRTMSVFRDSGSISALSSPTMKQQHICDSHVKKANERCESVMKLRHHIHLLEQENLGKISRIAELETELFLLKEQKLVRLEQLVEKLESDSKKKDLHIQHLEKQLQEARVHCRGVRPLSQLAGHEELCSGSHDQSDADIEETRGESDNIPLDESRSVENGEIA